MINDDHTKILKLIYELRRPDAKTINRLAVPSLHPRTLRRRLHELVNDGYIGAYGGKTERTYSLHLDGARAIGLENLPSNHRAFTGVQPPDPANDSIRLAKYELIHLAEQRGWSILQDVKKGNALDMRATQAVKEYLAEVGTRKHGVTVLPHQTTTLDFEVYPDYALRTHKEVIIVIFAGVNATRKFWTRARRQTKDGRVIMGRKQKYAEVISHVKAVAIIGATQEETANAVLDPKRYLVLRHDHLEELIRRLS